MLLNLQLNLMYLYASYLIPELGPCTLRITYSAHTDLSVKFQSHRSRYNTEFLIGITISIIKPQICWISLISLFLFAIY